MLRQTTHLRRLLLAGLVLIVVACPVRAENEGEEDLNAAVYAKLDAASLENPFERLRKLTEVVELIESALDKGLSEDKIEFANPLLAATLCERGQMIGGSIFGGNEPSAEWPQFRAVALKDLERAVKLDPRQPAALNLIARLNMLPGGDRERAREAVDEAIEVGEDDPETLAESLTLRAGMRDNAEEAIADLDRAIELNPGERDTLRARAALKATQGQYEDAIADFEKVLEIDPEHTPTYDAIALVLIEAEKYGRARKVLDRLAEIAPDSPIPLLRKAQILAVQEKYDAALKLLDEAILLDPDSVAVLSIRASVHEKLGDMEKAAADIDRILEIRPELNTPQLQASRLANQGDLQAAIGILKEHIAENPENVETLLQVAALHVLDKEHASAIAIYDQILQKQPKNLAALRSRADTYLGIGKHEEAIADYEAALEIDPDQSGVLNNLAWVLATSPYDELRDADRAIELATRGCELTNYEAAHILSTLAAGYAEKGDFKTAIKWSTEAVRLGDKDVREALQKELQSYKKGKPWRELLDESGEEVDLDQTDDGNQDKADGEKEKSKREKNKGKEAKPGAKE